MFEAKRPCTGITCAPETAGRVSTVQTRPHRCGAL